MRIRAEGDPPLFIIECPYCGCAKFELLSLGIPGTGTSVCLECRRPIAGWSHDPPPVITPNL